MISGMRPERGAEHPVAAEIRSPMARLSGDFMNAKHVALQLLDALAALFSLHI